MKLSEGNKLKIALGLEGRKRIHRSMSSNPKSLFNRKKEFEGGSKMFLKAILEEDKKFERVVKIIKSIKKIMLMSDSNC